MRRPRRPMKYRKFAELFGVICFVLLSCGIVIGGSSSESNVKQSNIKKAKSIVAEPIPEEYNDVINAFNLYWAAFKDRNFAKTYSMENSTYKKKFTEYSYTDKYAKEGVTVVGMKPLSVKRLNEKEVIVKGGLGYKAGFIDSVRVTEDHWIKEDDGWKHVQTEKSQVDKNNSNTAFGHTKEIVN